MTCPAIHLGSQQPFEGCELFAGRMAEGCWMERDCAAPSTTMPPSSPWTPSKKLFNSHISGTRAAAFVATPQIYSKIKKSLFFLSVKIQA